MKPSKLLLAALSIISLFMLVCCEVNSDLESDCDKTKWDKVEEPTISVLLSQPNNFCSAGDSTYKVDTAYQVNVTASIQKFYCDDTPSGRFDLTASYSPTISGDNVRLGQRYMFKFQNDKDNLVVECRLRAFFSDGAEFESEDLSFVFYYKDILYDINSIGYYILVVPNQFTWHASH